MAVVYVYSMTQLKREVENGRIVGCERCKAVFQDDDKAHVVETGTCPYCHRILDRATTI